jgi:hypothetical protein
MIAAKLQKGADLSMVNLQGAKLLHQSVDGGSEAVKWVIETTMIGVNSIDNNGITALMHAAMTGE